MDWATIWFGLIAVIFSVFFILEGFDYGIGILLPLVTKNDFERRALINTIGPVWDGNEVWMITAGGALFAAFPHAYATLFSGFYLALFVLLAALIFRGVSFEFRAKNEAPAWRQFWDTCIFLGSAIPALLWGVTVGNLLRGVPIDAHMQFVGSFFDLLNPYALAVGLLFLTLFTYHGLLYAALKTSDEFSLHIASLARNGGIPALLVCVVVAILTYLETDLAGHPAAVVSLLAAAAALIASVLFARQGRFGWSFVGSTATIGLFTATIFLALFPRLIVSSLNPAWSLTTLNASSSPYTLQLMTCAAAVLVPIVIAYQAWAYWIMRHRVTKKDLEY
jgi:cytochrome bd ubiquinol oxidase subunit II